MWAADYFWLSVGCVLMIIKILVEIVPFKFPRLDKNSRKNSKKAPTDVAYCKIQRMTNVLKRFYSSWELMDRRNEKKKTDVIWEITTILIEFLVTTYLTRKVYLQHSKRKKSWMRIIPNILNILMKLCWSNNFEIF